MAYSKKIIFQVLSYETDSIGQKLPVWKDLVSAWAQVNPVGGREYYAAAQVNSENDMIFKVRYSRLLEGYLTSELRIIYCGKVYNVVHIDDFMEKHREFSFRTKQLNGGGVNGYNNS